MHDPYGKPPKLVPRLARDHFAISVLESHVSTVGGKTGPVKGGYLRVRAPMFRLKLLEPGRGGLMSQDQLQFLELPLDTDHEWDVHSIYLDDHKWYHDPNWGSYKTYFRKFLPRLYPPNERSGDRVHSNPDGADGLKLTGLILELTGNDPGQYRRIGWLSTIAGDIPHVLEPYEYIEDMSDGTYVIETV